MLYPLSARSLPPSGGRSLAKEGDLAPTKVNLIGILISPTRIYPDRLLSADRTAFDGVETRIPVRVSDPSEPIDRPGGNRYTVPGDAKRRRQHVG